MNPDQPYEDESFAELRKLSAADSVAETGAYCFILRHKGSDVIYQVIARDRDELAAKIAAGQYEDVDPRNDVSPPGLDDDATDE